MKIKILYSHLNVSGTDNKYRPKWFDFEKCFLNFRETLGTYDKDIELHIIYDIARGKIEDNWLNKYQINTFVNVKIYEIQGGSMFGAAKEMYKVAKELSEDMKDDDLFYFCENDYLHVNGWVNKVKELFQTFKGLSYVTLYDHNDKYIHPHLYENLTSKLFSTETHHWRTVPNTCGSYICTKEQFLTDYDVHSQMEGDCNKWLHLVENRDRFILSPIPGLSTHCMETLMSPCVDWEKINKLVS